MMVPAIVMIFYFTIFYLLPKSIRWLIIRIIKPAIVQRRQKKLEEKKLRSKREKERLSQINQIETAKKTTVKKDELTEMFEVAFANFCYNPTGFNSNSTLTYNFQLRNGMDNLGFSFKNDSIDKALELFSKIQSKYPANRLAFELIAVSLYKLDKFSECLIHVDSGFEIFNNHVFLYQTRALIKEKFDDIAGAIQNNISALEIESTNLYSLLEISRLKIKLNEFRSALSFYNLAIKLYPKNTSVLLLRSKLNETLNRNEEALTDLNNCIFIEPNNIQAIVARVELNLRLKNYYEDNLDLKAIYLNYKDNPLHSSFLNSNLHLEECLRTNFLTINVVISDYPGNIDLCLLRIYLKFRLHLYDAAILDVNNLLYIHQDLYGLVAYRAKLKSLKNDFRGSCSDYQTAIELYPKEQQSQNLKGKIDLVLHRNFTSSLIKPSKANLFLDLAITQSKLDEDKATDYYRSFRNLDIALSYSKSDFESGLIYYWRAKIYFLLDDLHVAYENIQKSLSLNPNFPITQKLETEILSKLNNSSVK